MTAHQALYAIGPIRKQPSSYIYVDGALNFDEMMARKNKRRRDKRLETEVRINAEMQEWVDKLEKLLRETGPMKTSKALSYIGVPQRESYRVRFIATQRMLIYEDDGEMGLLDV